MWQRCERLSTNQSNIFTQQFLCALQYPMLHKLFYAVSFGFKQRPMGKSMLNKWMSFQLIIVIFPQSKDVSSSSIMQSELCQLSRMVELPAFSPSHQVPHYHHIITKQIHTVEPKKMNQIKFISVYVCASHLVCQAFRSEIIPSMDQCTNEDLSLSRYRTALSLISSLLQREPVCHSLFASQIPPGALKNELPETNAHVLISCLYKRDPWILPFQSLQIQSVM